MDAFIYAADLFCEDCGERIREQLTREGKAPANPDDEHTYDSDYFPKGPFPDGGGEADTVCHCAGGKDCPNAIEFGDGFKAGCMLENDLTNYGVEWLKEQAREAPDNELVQLWMKTYRQMGYDL